MNENEKKTTDLLHPLNPTWTSLASTPARWPCTSPRWWSSSSWLSHAPSPPSASPPPRCSPSVERSTEEFVRSVKKEGVNPQISKVKVAGVKVYPRQIWNFRSHAATKCMSQADACTYCMHCPMMSQADTAWALLFQFHLGHTFILRLLWSEVKSFTADI